ncbi:pilus assembly protein [Massilia sp. R2A-15]|uniref:pilus assembly protein n=1 Tax=Massilia sp. R2A-15 TaxID=3064278 RepID=UPI002732DE04|nr:pilus assembly protein [Massilia sp. R2A-15]WLI87750.1 pilus assembly protein [Massilia sp. R2A-15]
MLTRPHLAWSICAAVAGILATGCTTMTPNLDRQFGSNVNLLKAQQVIDPAAPARATPVSVDGETAHEAVNRYYKSYKAPTPPPGAFTINAVGKGS